MFTKEKAAWIYDSYAWLGRHLPRRDLPLRRRLILPTLEFFPDKFSNDHASAKKVLDRMRAHMGMSNWDCTLMVGGAQESDLNSAMSNSGVVGERTFSDAAGTFQRRGRIITYSSGLLQEPLVLTATIAHELCHLLLSEVPEFNHIRESDREPLTDLTSVVEGLGLFSCHAAFQFRQWSDPLSHGWSVRRLGYLTEEEFAFAIGIFTIRNEVSPDLVMKYLRQNPRQVFSDSLNYVREIDEAKRPIKPFETAF
jgi:hypothetical protein